jgi:hypothetical protein
LYSVTEHEQKEQQQSMDLIVVATQCGTSEDLRIKIHGARFEGTLATVLCNSISFFDYGKVLALGSYSSKSFNHLEGQKLLDRVW